MNFSIPVIMHRYLAPQHELSCNLFVWRRLLRGLRKRGRSRSRESGAFLLGSRTAGRSRIVDFVLYDDLDPLCLDTGIVRFDGTHFGKLWDLCRERGLSVVADIHVHPGGAGQSDSDRAHPMITRAGHLAFILPNFAVGSIRRKDIGMYRYQGAKKWQTIVPAQRRLFFSIGI